MESSPRPSVLLLDPAFSAGPIHDYLTSVGCDVWVMGNRDSDLLVVYRPDRWVRGDYSNKADVASAIEKLAIDYVVPGCTDVSMASFAALNFTGPYRYSAETDVVLNAKDHFRWLCEDLSLPSPRIVTRENLPPHGMFICKPVDGFSGRGVSIFDASDQGAVKRAFKLALEQSKTRRVICEEYVQGQLYSYSAFLKDRSVDTAFVVREGSKYDRFAVDTSYVVHRYDKSASLKRCVEAIAARLSLSDGLVHLQFIESPHGLYLIEVTRRCPGDLYSLLIEYSTGYPYAARYASYFIDRTVEASHACRRHIIRHTLKQPGGSFFRSFDFDVDLQVRRLVPLRRLGEHVDGDGFQRTALVFAEETSVDSLEQKYELLTSANGALQSLQA